MRLSLARPWLRAVPARVGHEDKEKNAPSFMCFKCLVAAVAAAALCVTDAGAQPGNPRCTGPLSVLASPAYRPLLN